MIGFRCKIAKVGRAHFATSAIVFLSACLGVECRRRHGVVLSLSTIVEVILERFTIFLFNVLNGGV